LLGTAIVRLWLPVKQPLTYACTEVVGEHKDTTQKHGESSGCGVAMLRGVRKGETGILEMSEKGQDELSVLYTHT
jgi:hypothetical protein